MITRSVLLRHAGRHVRPDDTGAEVESDGTNVYRDYDESGNVNFSTEAPWDDFIGQIGEMQQYRSSRWYYGADEKLRGLQRDTRKYNNSGYPPDDLIEEYLLRRTGAPRAAPHAARAILRDHRVRV